VPTHQPPSPVNQRAIRRLFGDGRWRTLADMASLMYRNVPAHVAIRALRRMRNVPGEVQNSDRQVYYGTVQLLRLALFGSKDSMLSRGTAERKRVLRGTAPVYRIKKWAFDSSRRRPTCRRPGAEPRYGITPGELFEAVRRYLSRTGGRAVTRRWVAWWLKKNVDLKKMRERVAARQRVDPMKVAALTEDEVVTLFASDYLKDLVCRKRLTEVVVYRLSDKYNYAGTEGDHGGDGGVRVGDAVVPERVELGLQGVLPAGGYVDGRLQ